MWLLLRNGGEPTTVTVVISHSLEAPLWRNPASRHRGALHLVGTIGSNIAADYFRCQWQPKIPIRRGQANSSNSAAHAADVFESTNYSSIQYSPTTSLFIVLDPGVRTELPGSCPLIPLNCPVPPINVDTVEYLSAFEPSGFGVACPTTASFVKSLLPSSNIQTV